mgnify:FL=1
MQQQQSLPWWSLLSLSLLMLVEQRGHHPPPYERAMRTAAGNDANEIVCGLGALLYSSIQDYNITIEWHQRRHTNIAADSLLLLANRSVPKEDEESASAVHRLTC